MKCFFPLGVLISKLSLTAGGQARSRGWDGSCEMRGDPGAGRSARGRACWEALPDQLRICGWMRGAMSNFPNSCSCVKYSRAAGHELLIQQTRVCLAEDSTDDG